ncbi:MAG: hypothetical protein QXU32_04035 [Nitrososphaerales archaeon]
MSEHNRREGYWKYYHLAHTLEKDAVVSNIVSLVKGCVLKVYSAMLFLISCKLTIPML